MGANVSSGCEEDDVHAMSVLVSRYEELRRSGLSELQLYRELERSLSAHLQSAPDARGAATATAAAAGQPPPPYRPGPGDGAISGRRVAPAPASAQGAAEDGGGGGRGAAEAAAEAATGAGGQAVISVLVVDDSHISCKLASRTLNMMGYRVDVALSGESALGMLRERPTAYDLVLLDIVMPGLDGIEVLSRLKAAPATASNVVAMLSGLEDRALADVCRAQGAVEVLLKPLKANAVSRVVAKHCRPRRSPAKPSSQPPPASPAAVAAAPPGGAGLPQPQPPRSREGSDFRLTGPFSRGAGGGSGGGASGGSSGPDSPNAAPALQQGDRCPDFSLPDGSGHFGPSSIDGAARLVLAFFPAALARDVARCGDRLLSALNRHYAALRATGAEVVAVGPEPPHALVALQQDLGLRFRVLSDPSLEVAAAYVGCVDLTAWAPAAAAPPGASAAVAAAAAAACRSSHAGVVVLSPALPAGRVVEYCWRAVDAWGEFDADAAIDMHDLMSHLLLSQPPAGRGRTSASNLGPAAAAAAARAGGIAADGAGSGGGGGGGSGAAMPGGGSYRVHGSGSKSPLSIRNAGRVSILVVDDSNISSKLALRKLAALGHDTMHAENGQVALELLRRFPTDFDLVLLDIVMPVMDGVELLTIMQADKKLRHVPTVMLSGLEDDMLASVCLESGATAVLKKPLDTGEVEELISSAGIGRR